MIDFISSRFTLFVTALVSFLLSLPLVAGSAGDSSEVKSSNAVTESGKRVMGQELDVTASVIQVFMGLGVIILVILLLAWLLKRVYRWQAPQQSMRVVSSLALGTRERALLVDVNGQQMLLGVTSNQVTLLKAFEEPVIPVEHSRKSSAFAEQLAEAVRGKKHDPQADVAPEGDLKGSGHDTDR
jgi:flagellar protein FliO/FliZ